MMKFSFKNMFSSLKNSVFYDITFIFLMTTISIVNLFFITIILTICWNNGIAFMLALPLIEYHHMVFSLIFVIFLALNAFFIKKFINFLRRVDNKRKVLLNEIKKVLTEVKKDNLIKK